MSIMKKHEYTIQHRIRTLADNAVGASSQEPAFDINGVTFTQWEFNHRDGWLGDAWVAEFKTSASSYTEAINQLRRILMRVIPRISLISQTYILHLNETFLITRADKDYGLIYHVQEDDPSGLMFMEGGKKALEKLLANESINEEFYYYWNDAVNAPGYTSKLLLMFAALEALTKKGNRKNNYVMLEKILGKDLKDEIFAQKTGLRNRLSHGEHLSNPGDTANNYFILIHKKIVEFFNNEVIGEKLISEDTVSPHRNFFGNFSSGWFFIKPSSEEVKLDLRQVVQAYQAVDELNLENYEYVFGDETKGF